MDYRVRVHDFDGESIVSNIVPTISVAFNIVQKGVLVSVPKFHKET